MKITQDTVSKQIATLIKNCDVNCRGILFREIGAKLINDSQGYTGNLFVKMGYMYGVNDTDLDDPAPKLQ